MMAALRLENLTKHFLGGVRAVDGLSLEVHDGELLTLVGPSGCGKTTTLRMIAGLEVPTAGSITLDDRRLGGVAPKNRDVAMVFQRHALYPHLTVAGNLGFGLKLRGLDASQIRRRVDRAANMLGIAGLLARRPGELSGGQQQRVALGRAIVRQAGLFLFDEPLSNLDPALRYELRAEIRQLQAELATTTIYVTHDQAEAMTLGRRIAVMHQGRLQQLADPATIYRRPANRTVAAMFGSPGMNFLEGRIAWQDGAVMFAWGDPKSERLTLPLPSELSGVAGRCVDGAITLGVRPEHLLPTGQCAAESPRFAATVEGVECVGAVSLLHLRAGGQSLVMRTAAAGLPTSGPVEVGLLAANVRLFDSHSGQSLE